MKAGPLRPVARQIVRRLDAEPYSVRKRSMDGH
jgi:hypothetical protein